MLVLSRMQGESIMIGDDVEITVVAVRNGHGGFKVRLGITADKSIPVNRREIHVMIKSQRENAARKYDSPEQQCYKKAKHRCRCVTAQGYERYGGRGIEFRFTSFDELLEDIGCRPSPEHSLDRKDNNGHYEKGNVRWATRVEQMRNTRSNRIVVYGGESEPLSYWAEKIGMGKKTLACRLDAGWSVKDAIETPVGKRKWLTPNEVTEVHSLSGSGASTKDIALQFGVCLATVTNVLSGKTFREIFDAVTQESEVTNG